MEIDLTTPALLFSAISLIMLAYTNRFPVVCRPCACFEGTAPEKPFVCDRRTDRQLA